MRPGRRDDLPVCTQARWEKGESTDTPRICTNYAAAQYPSGMPAYRRYIRSAKVGRASTIGVVTPQNMIVKHLCILALEVSVAVRESSDLCWAHEGEVQWVEEQHNILALQADAILASTTPATYAAHCQLPSRVLCYWKL